MTLITAPHDNVKGNAEAKRKSTSERWSAVSCAATQNFFEHLEIGRIKGTEKLQRERSHADAWDWTCSRLSCEKINLSYLMLLYLLWQPGGTKAEAFHLGVQVPSCTTMTYFVPRTVNTQQMLAVVSLPLFLLYIVGRGQWDLKDSERVPFLTRYFFARGTHNCLLFLIFWFQQNCELMARQSLMFC